MIAETSQMGLLEEAIESEELRDALLAWQYAKDALKPYREAYRARHEALKEEIEAMELPDGEYRVGRWKIVIKEREEGPHEVIRKGRRSVRVLPAKEGD